MDFSKMAYDISKVPTGQSVLDYFPKLAEHKEFSNPHQDSLVRLCFLATDQESPFVIAERDDYEKRLVKILEYLKISDKKLLAELVNGDNNDYELMVTKFLMQCDNLAYTMWYDKLRMFHYISMALRKPIDYENILADSKKRADLDEQREKIYNTLLNYESQIFPDAPTRVKLRQQVAKLLQPAEMYSQPKNVF